MTVMCGLEPLLKRGQLDGQASTLLPAAPLVLSNADLRLAKERLKEGDIIFRTGNTGFTRVAARFTANTPYSDGGIITFEGSRLMVVSASPEGVGNRIVEEPLANFLQKGNTTRAGIYRLKASKPTVQRAIATAAKTYQAENTSFDSEFDLPKDQAVCSDFIRCAYLEAGIDLASQEQESFSWPFMDQWISTHSLSSSASLQPVYRFDPVQSMQSALP